MDFFCVEEDLVGYKLHLRGRDSTIDMFDRVTFKDKDGVVITTTTNIMTFETDATEGAYAQLPVFDGVAGYNWVLPGAGFRVAETVHETALFTNTRELEYTISADDLSPKNFDGGIHSWIKLDNAGTTTSNAMYSKPIPMDFLQGQNSLLVFNSLGNKHLYDTILNRALTLHLEGSLDGVNYETLGLIFEDIDICNVDGLSNAFQYPYMISGSSYPKYNYYRFMWYVEDNTWDEANASKQNFILLSLYKISR